MESCSAGGVKLIGLAEVLGAIGLILPVFTVLALAAAVLGFLVVLG